MKSVTASLTMPLLAIAFALLARPWLAANGVAPAQGALLAGAAAGALAYYALAAKHARAAASKAVFVGLIVAQTVLVPRSQSVLAAAGFVISVTILFMNLRMIEQ
jgi:hypothetical protein